MSSEYSNENLFLTIVVPMFNAQDKMDHCLASLRELPSELSHEVIFVDDSSDDGTFQRLVAEASGEDAWSVLTTPENTGTPSAGRNLGIRESKGEWVFFLDGDDSVCPDGLASGVQRAREGGVDMVRGSVDLVHVGVRELTIDRVDPAVMSFDRVRRIATIAQAQSLTCMALIRKSLLLDKGIYFDEKIRMGEDIVFTAQALTSAVDVAYIDSSFFRYWRRQGGAESAMHSLGSREISELADSWTRVEEAFQLVGLSYIELHGLSTIGYALRQLIQHRRENISYQAFSTLSAFSVRFSVAIQRLVFPERLQLIVDSLTSGSFQDFELQIRPRLVIAGHDLKFIRDAEPELSTVFTIRYDEWPSERVHDRDASTATAVWADLVWCEWLTECAVWYSNNISPPTKMVVRVHRYELGRTYGDQINETAVSAFVAIAPHCYEDLVDRFDFSRSKVRYIPNYYRVSEYEQGTGKERLKRLAIIGIAPRRKGYLKALQVLEDLRRENGEYTLTVFGKDPLEYPWISGDPEEQAYYSACKSFIEQSDLGRFVINAGWVDTKQATKDFGFVLSTSEHEGSHVGPGEAFCAGNQGVFLPWRGVEYVYPERFVFETPSAIADHIRANQEVEHFEKLAAEGRSFMVETYDVSLFLDRVVKLWKSL